MLTTQWGPRVRLWRHQWISLETTPMCVILNYWHLNQRIAYRHVSTALDFNTEIGTTICRFVEWTICSFTSRTRAPHTLETQRAPQCRLNIYLMAQLRAVVSVDSVRGNLDAPRGGAVVTLVRSRCSCGMQPTADVVVSVSLSEKIHVSCYWRGLAARFAWLGLYKKKKKKAKNKPFKFKNISVL